MQLAAKIVVAVCLAGVSCVAGAVEGAPTLTPEQNKILHQLVGPWQAVPKGDVLPDGIKVEHPYAELEKLSVEHLAPWAKAEHDATEWDIDDTGTVCKLDGYFRAGLDFNGAFSIVPGHGKLVWLTNNFEELGNRDLYLNTPHPDDLLPTWNGDSRAHFEGNAFVIDTIGYNDKVWLGSDRVVHTEELHVIEYITLHGDGQYLDDRVIIDDRKALSSPYTFERVWKRAPLFPKVMGAEFGMAPGTGGVRESVCNQERIGRDPWRRTREGLIVEHQQMLDAFIKQVKPQE